MTNEKHLRFTKEELLEKLKGIEIEKVNAIKNQNYAMAATFRDREREIREQIDENDNKHSR